MKKEISLKLEVEEVNIILQALGQMPYISVVNVIDKVKLQGEAQINTDASK